MSYAQKFKEFLGLDADAMEVEDAYLAPEADYGDTARSRDYLQREPAATNRSYGMYTTPAAPRVVEKSIRSFDQAASVGADYRDGCVVVFSVSRAEVTVARRIVDFAAGLCYALNGSMKKMETGSFALIPEGVTMTKSEIRRALDA